MNAEVEMLIQYEAQPCNPVRTSIITQRSPGLWYIIWELVYTSSLYTDSRCTVWDSSVHVSTNKPHMISYLQTLKKLSR